MAESNNAAHEIPSEDPDEDCADEHGDARAERNKHRLGNLPYAILGLIAHRPEGAHGYQLRQEIESICEDISQLTYGRLYSTLELLAREGKLHLVDCIQRGRPNRKVYQVTDAGRETLAQWLVAPVSEDPRPLRDEIALKVLFLDHGNAQALAAHIEQHRRLCLKRLARLARRRKRLEKAKLAPGAIDLILQGPELHVRAELAWLKEVEGQVGD